MRRAVRLCYFFVVQQRSNQESELGRSLRGLPRARKVAALRSAHFFAKGCIFSFCVCKLKKLANTEDARKRKSKSFCHLRRTRVKQNFKQKRFCFLRLPPKRAVEAPAPTEKEKAFSSSACRAWWQGGGRCSRVKMSFSPACLVARHGSGFQRRQPLVRFLGSFFLE